MRNVMTAVLATGLLAAMPAAMQAQQDFQWRGRIEAGKTLEIKGVLGDIVAEPGDGDMVVVVAEKRARRDDPEDVRIEVIEHGDGVTICAVYPTPRRSRQENECAPGNGGHMNVQDNDVRVRFMVRIPRGVNFAAKTVNGDVQARGIQGNVRANSVNGEVDVDASGYVDAQTVNGSITARMGRSDFRDGLSFSTVNGSITVEIPDGLNADFEASTVNGRIETDFPITIEGRMSPRRLRGRIGDGGPDLSFSTVNGSIRLRRR